MSEKQPYQVKEYAWCFNVPPRCSKYKIKFKEVLKTQILVKQRPVEECCDGYTPDSEGKLCVPVCVESCVHGKCVAPNTCACSHGYGGPACDICTYLFFVLFKFLLNFICYLYIRQMQLFIDKIELGQNRNNKTEAFSLTESYIGKPVKRIYSEIYTMNYHKLNID